MGKASTQLISLLAAFALAGACSETKFAGDSAPKGKDKKDGAIDDSGVNPGPNGSDGGGGIKSELDVDQNGRGTADGGGLDDGGGNGGTGGLDNDDEESNGNLNSGGDSSECIEGDKVELFYPKRIQDCINSGRLYNFDADICTEMRAAEFECNFDNVIAWLDGKGLKSSFFKEGKKKNGLMVGCGQSPDGKTLIAQYWFPPDKDAIDCNYKAGVTGINTGCYKINYTGPPVNFSNEEEVKNFVLGCMTEN